MKSKTEKAEKVEQTPKVEKKPGLAIGLTGGIGCGKSTVGQLLAEQGMAVLDADVVAHELLTRGSPVYHKVVARFGPSILGAGGAIDRAKLGRMIFEDEAGRLALNEMTHPAVIEEVRRWVARTTRGGKDAVALIPLLFETGMVDGWDVIVCVAADTAVTLERLRARGMTEKEARRRMAAQWPVEQKAAKSDLVITNNGSIDALKVETARVQKQLREKEKKANV